MSSVIGGVLGWCGLRNPNLNQVPPVTTKTYTTPRDTTGADQDKLVVEARDLLIKVGAF